MTGGFSSQVRQRPKLGSLCSGAGGLDLAVEEVFGAETAWHAEVDPAASKVLAHRWPGVPNHGDLTTADWGSVDAVDVMCAGWPCQPFSLAGKKQGAEDERAIWPYVAGAIRALRPQYVVLENVTAIVGPEFGRVANSLAADGYDLRWTCLRAADVGAPHWRNRFFAVATNTDFNGLEARRFPSGSETQVAGYHGGVVSLPDAEDDGCERGWETRRRGPGPTNGGGDAVWGRYGVAVERWERLTRPAPFPVEDGPNGPRLNARFAEWMLGWPDGWVTDVALSRAEMFRVIGNGVCPQQAHAALTWLFSLDAAEVAA